TQKTTQRILEVLRITPSAGRRAIAEQLGDITEDGVKYQISKMKAEGLIVRIGPDKGGYWKIIEQGSSGDD
ncbi:MAG: ATP-dependent DNA helicase, partial [Candidatus Sedimenticola sp. (ex Thyasira tokunagai)]